MYTEFRLNQLTPKTLLAGLLILVGTPIFLFLLIYYSDAPTVIAWCAALTPSIISSSEPISTQDMTEEEVTHHQNDRPA